MPSVFITEGIALFFFSKTCYKSNLFARIVTYVTSQQNLPVVFSTDIGIIKIKKQRLHISWEAAK